MDFWLAAVIIIFGILSLLFLVVLAIDLALDLSKSADNPDDEQNKDLFFSDIVAVIYWIFLPVLLLMTIVNLEGRDSSEDGWIAGLIAGAVLWLVGVVLFTYEWCAIYCSCGCTRIKTLNCCT